MKTPYKGYTITADRVSEDWLDWAIIRDQDGFVADCGFYSGAETESEYTRLMKGRIDNEHATDDPWLEKESVNV